MLAVVSAAGVIELLLPDDADLSRYDVAGKTVRPATAADMPPPPAPSLTASQIMSLFSVSEHARARRLLTATFPPGHAQAGELIDPQAHVQVLIDRLAALGDRRLALSDPFVVQGAALFLAYGLFDGATAQQQQARAAQVLAGQPPPAPVLLPGLVPTEGAADE